MSKRIWLLAAALAACTHTHGPQDSTQTGNPPVLDRTRLTLEVGADGVHITGDPGAVTPGGATIEITNLTTGEVTEGMAAPDGSFDVRVDGSPNDAFVVRVSANGEQSAPVHVDDGSLTCERYTSEIAVTHVDKLDLLFVVDDSDSMKQEQESLQEQVPRLIQILATGDRDLDGNNDFPPVIDDLHLGVVSSDMGLVGIEGVDRCNGLGDDGLLQHEPSSFVQGCQSAYPLFLTYTAGINQPAETANDFACMAILGTDGCGFGQPLESALKALWPANDPMPVNGMNRITFLGDVNGFGQQGHGDGENAGFLRNDPAEGLSMIAIIMVTDKEDCSSADTSHFVPPSFLDPSDPLVTQDMNLRCFYNKQNLYPLQRYINGYKALRPGNENLVIFSAVVGVPPDVVEQQDLDAVDWESDTERNAFYDRILADPRMQETVDPNRTPEQGAKLTQSCLTARGLAYPPIRIVNVARGFGPNGTVHSICQEDLSGVLDSIIEGMAKQLGAACLPQPLIRNSAGLTACDVIWELPPEGMNSPMTPTQCQTPSYPFLLPPDSGQPAVNDRGGQICKVAQLAIEHQSFVPTVVDGMTFSEGWYFDDFSDDVTRECTGATKQRVRFTPAARPPTGVSVKLECPRDIAAGGNATSCVD